MNILYYDWEEFTGPDCRSVMEELGHTVRTFRYQWDNSYSDEGFEREAERLLSEKTGGAPRYDLVFSFNFFPSLSDAAQNCHIPYISWVFDSPHVAMQSRAVHHPVNLIYQFDGALCREMRQQGYGNVLHCPLGVNGKRMMELCHQLDGDRSVFYEHDVTFLGSLYDNRFSFYDQSVPFLPDAMHGYLDAVLSSARQFFDVDLIGDLQILPLELIREVDRYMRVEVTGHLEIDADTVTRDVLRKKVTQLERRRVLEELGGICKLDLYTKADSPVLRNVYDLGPAEYFTQMPEIFHRSRINLNLCLRSIRSGISLRAMDILAAGGFLLSTWKEEMDRYFRDGEELVLCRNPEDLKQAVRYYLSPEAEEERKQIAARGQAAVIERFDYRVLLPQILEGRQDIYKEYIK